MTIILGIETSCDETSIALVKDGKQILSNIVSSQILLHEKYGGIVPEIASRQHILTINPLLTEAFKEAGINFNDIDAIGVTYGPGLAGALMVGLVTAKTLAWILKKPLIGVNHLEGHIYSNFLAFHDLEPRFLVLLISGGHTNLIEMTEHGKYKIIGQTLDDAIGECFDKVGRLLNLPYPGGPNIDKIGKTGNKKMFDFPRAMMDKDDFSFSGIKTAVLYKIKDLKKAGIKELPINDLSASFQEAVVDSVIFKTIRTGLRLNLNKIVIAGGVAANSRLRDKLKEVADSNNMKLFLPPLNLCTDNAAMIACAAYYHFIKHDVNDLYLQIRANLKLV